MEERTPYRVNRPEEKFYLLDLERTIGFGRVFYWKSNKHGYTNNLEEAGLYSKEAADQIVEDDFDNNTISISEKKAKQLWGI